MIRNLLILLLLTLGNIIWTASLKAQGSDSIICLTAKQIDYFIEQEVETDFLRSDTNFKAIKIKYLNKVINKQADIISGNESIIKLNNKELDDYKASFNDLSIKFTKQSKKVSLFKNGTIIFICTTVILSGLLLLK